MARLILVIEASTPTLSVALLTETAVVADIAVTSRDPVTGARVEGLMPAIAACFDTARANPDQLSAVICSAGPGGFTSLRSAAAIAKGLCSVLCVPLYALSSIELLVATAHLAPGDYMAAIDAGRGEYYTHGVEVADGSIIAVTPVALLSRGMLEFQARERHARLVGPGLDIDVSPRASAAVSMLSRITASDPVLLDTWEPRYGRLAEAQVKWESAHGRPLSL